MSTLQLQHFEMKRKQAKQNKPVSNKSISSGTKLPAIDGKKPAPNSHKFSLNTSHYQDDGLIMLIHEYFIKNNFFDSLETFQRDCLKGFKPSVKPLEALKKELVELFDSGSRDAFVTKFNRYVALSLRTKDMQTMKLEFYLQLYFFIYSTHPILGKKKTVDTLSKQHFIGYLEGRGAVLAKQTEFLQFYALGYLQKPQEHQNFKQMFTKQWIQQLRKQLVFFLDKLYPPGKTPSLVTVYDRFIEQNLEAQKYSSAVLTEPDEEPQIEEQIEEEDSMMQNPSPVLLESRNEEARGSKQSIEEPAGRLLTEKEKDEVLELNERVNELEEEKVSLINFIETSKHKYQNLENEFKQFSQKVQGNLMESQQKWFRIAQELHHIAKDILQAAQNLSSGLPLPQDGFLTLREQKLSKYESFVNMNVDDLFSDNIAEYSLFERPDHDTSVDMTRDAARRNHDYFEVDQKPVQIDFAQIKETLAFSSALAEMNSEQERDLDTEKCVLLQSLRWRVTRVKGAFQKREVILSYTKMDVLGLKASSAEGAPKVIEVLLGSQNRTVRLYTMLLISALSKDYYGREYFSDEGLIKALIGIFLEGGTDESTRAVILVFFQQQSNKPLCRELLIEDGVLEVIIEKLDAERDSMNKFMMEYTSALMVNLVLVKKGLDRAEQIGSRILLTLINLMEAEQSVKSFVHAALYNLLERRAFREKALEFGMQENIKYLLENSQSSELEHQLRYIHERLCLEEDPECKSEHEDDELDDINDEEIGEDVEILAEELESPLAGEYFLMKKYALIGPEGVQQMNAIQEDAKATFERSIYLDRDYTERLSVQTPLLGKGRKSNIGGMTHNNSVYSNKSSNRVLRSEKNSRIKNEVSLKNMSTMEKAPQKPIAETALEFNGSASNQPQANDNNELFKNFDQNESSGKFKEDKVLEMNDAQGTFRQKQETPSPTKEQKTITPLDPQYPPERKLKPHENTEEYREAFQTRAHLVRTPPQKQRPQ